MARKKNLERAVVLGLILSTGVYGNAWATNVPAISNSSRDYDVKDNVIVKANTTSDTEDGIGNIILRDVGQYTVSIKTTGGNIEFEKNNGTGILLADRIATGTKVALNASGDIIIDAKNGIQGNASARDENNVSTITLNAQNNRITATETAVYGLGKVDIELTAGKDNVIVTTGNDYAVKTDANSAGILNITAQDGNNIIKAEKGTAIRANGNKVITIKANNKDNEENGNNIIIGGENGIQHNEEGKDADGQTIVKDANTKYVIIDGKNNVVYGGENGILSDGTGITYIKATQDNSIGFLTNDKGEITDIAQTGINVTEGTVNVTAGGSNIIKATDTGIYTNGNNSYTEIESDKLKVLADNLGKGFGSSNAAYGIWGKGDNKTQITTNNGTYFGINTSADGYAAANNGYGIYAEKGAHVDINSTEGNNIINVGVFVDEENQTIKVKENGIQAGIKASGTATARTNVEVEAVKGINSIRGTVGIEASNSNVDLIAGNSNLIYAGDTFNGFGKSYAVNASSGSTVILSAGNANDVYGAVYANGTGKDEEGNDVPTTVTLDSANNIVKSYAIITGAGDLDQDETGEMKDAKVISALYAEEGASINVTGENYIRTYAVSDDPDLERVVWAYDTADIDITGLTAISTDSYDKQTNSKDIAIAAGTATGLENLSLNDILNYDTIVGKRASVKVNYESDSSITGDILSAYGGEVNITPNSTTTKAASDAKINIHGNLLAGNNGKLTVDLGKGGSLTGRADDYGDAGLNTGHGAVDSENSFFNPAFSSEIKANGTVNLTMGVGSRWDVTGQSWITSLTTTGNAEDTLISLEKAKEDLNSNASALTIGTLKGDTRFYMNLDGDRSASDMLYIKNAQGVNGETAQYDIYLQEEVTSGEINAGGFNGLRFATVGEGSKANFTVRSQGTGSAFDVEYEVDTDSYVGNSENSAYNSTTGGDANVEKPGNDSVNDFFDLSSGTQEDTTETVANNIMLMAENEEAAENVAMNNNTGLDEVTNFKIVARKGEEISDTGKTILNMSRANYSNAIYMDRLNKRLGEARYINSEEDEGMWVRIRHDRIGKDAAYRSQNTMYELGYDQKQECDNGERRVGMAIDYMHGDTGYDQIAGKGEIDRYGLWLYDTWMGDKGHYADYVAKWGHLSNDFEVYTMQNGDKVTGDYSNNVFSVSAEYGRKKDIGNDWYFEPQVQAQLARVTGADYTTNQGTKVSVDGINSLIGRAGFRLGKDFGEEKQSTVYIKADVLHEFLGDQDVRVLDKSSDNKWAGISYENEGTWYDVGFGFATQMSKNSYAFMDFEKSFGNDNDETYQINVGMQWSF